MDFSCLKCILSFSNRDELKNHLKSDLHLDNCKRVLIGVSPLLPQEHEIEKNKKADSIIQCNKKNRPVKKKTNRKNNLIASLDECNNSDSNISKQINSKNKTVEIGYNEVDELSSVQDENCNDNIILNYSELDDYEYDLKLSLFDNHISRNFEEGMKYMKEHFSFRIPNEKYCVDIKQFISYLGEKIHIGKMCLYCNIPYKTIIGVKQHMKDKGHRKIGIHLPEHIEEYELFFDYSTSYKELNLTNVVYEKVEQFANTTFNKTEDEDDEQDMQWSSILRKCGYENNEIMPNGDLLIKMFNKKVLNKKNTRIFGNIVANNHSNKDYRIYSNTKKILMQQQNDIKKQSRLYAIHKNENIIKYGMKVNIACRPNSGKNKIFL